MKLRAAAGLIVGLYAVLCLVAADAPVRTINLTVGKGELLQFQHDIVKVVIAEPKISDAIVVSPREVMINAKGAGHTTLVIWETGAAPARYEIAVYADTTDRELWRQGVDTELRAALTGTTVQFSGNAENLVLTGKVESAEQSKRAEAIAATHSKKVVNLLTVPPPAELKQILLQVKFASVDRVALSQVGFNLFSTNPKMIGATSTGQFQPPRFSPLQLQGSDFNGTNVNFADLLN